MAVSASRQIIEIKYFKVSRVNFALNMSHFLESKKLTLGELKQANMLLLRVSLDVVRMSRKTSRLESSSFTDLAKGTFLLLCFMVHCSCSTCLEIVRKTRIYRMK